MCDDVSSWQSRRPCSGKGRGQRTGNAKRRISVPKRSWLLAALAAVLVGVAFGLVLLLAARLAIAFL